MRVEWESFELILELDMFLLAKGILQLYLLKHELGKERDAVASLEVTLSNQCKGLNDN